MSPALATAIGAVIIALVTGLFGYLNSTRANRPAESNAQLAWVKQAQEEAREARVEAKEAKAEAGVARAESVATRIESEHTQQQQVTLRREMDAMQDWMERVMRAADAYRAEHPSGIEDSGVIRILKAINGGPRRGHGDAQ